MIMAKRSRYQKKHAQKPAPQDADPATAIAEQQSPASLTKQQRKAVKKAIEQGIEQYKRQHKAKLRQQDKQRKKANQVPAFQPSGDDGSRVQALSKKQIAALMLPWCLLVLSWLYFLMTSIA